MELWQRLLSGSIRTPEALARRLPGVDTEQIRDVTEKYPMCINPYYLSLIQEAGDPIWKQAIPDMAEQTHDWTTCGDPLEEESMSPVPCLVHRYPDRVLFLVTTQCAMYCRFCTRKRKVGLADESISRYQRDQAIQYIQEHPEIRDVVVSGGDPLTLTDTVLEEILAALRAIEHVEIIRIGSRVPCVLPQRVTPRLVRMLKRYAPLYLNTHFEHPSELTREAETALRRLVEAGIVVGNQSVLLKGVNDDSAVMLELNRRLLKNRVRPYYLYQADLVEGTGHFRTSVEAGLDILRNMRGHTSGLAIPQYVIDAPGGGGKIPLLPPETVEVTQQGVMLRNYQGNQYFYPDAAEPTKHRVRHRAFRGRTAVKFVR